MYHLFFVTVTVTTFECFEMLKYEASLAHITVPRLAKEQERVRGRGEVCHIGKRKTRKKESV